MATYTKTRLTREDARFVVEALRTSAGAADARASRAYGLVRKVELQRRDNYSALAERIDEESQHG